MPTVNLKALINKLNRNCQQTLELAASYCLSLGHYDVEVEHWLIKLLEIDKTDIKIILSYYEIDLGKLKQDLVKRLAYYKTGNNQSPVLSQRLIDWMKEALIIASLDENNQFIRSGHLLNVLLSNASLNQLAINSSAQFTRIAAEQIQVNFFTLIQQSTEQEKIHSSTETNKIQSALEQFTINLTEQARQGNLDPVLGRDSEIRQIINILLCRRQNNPILTGEPGVGKTAVAEGLALLIVQGNVPDSLKNVSIRMLDLGMLQAGAGIKGEFEKRLKSVIQEIKTASHPVILFIDEAHMIAGTSASQGQHEMANLLKPFLARGELRTIAATTWAEYKKFFEQDAALARRFQVVTINEPDEETAKTILRGLISNLEKHHQVRILDEAIVAAVELSHRYLTSRQLPDKAISVLDNACARLAIKKSSQPAVMKTLNSQIDQLQNEIVLLQREHILNVEHKERLQKLSKNKIKLENQLNIFQNRWKKEHELINQLNQKQLELEIFNQQQTFSAKNLSQLSKQFSKLQSALKQLQGESPLLNIYIDKNIIAEVIAEWTGIPIGRMLTNEVSELLSLESSLNKRIIGQPQALNIIAKTVRTARANLADPTKPSGIFLLVGPSGTGKTETALALAQMLYGSEQNITTINLSEYKEEHKVSLLLGSPPGYVGYGEGGILTEAIRKKPYSLLLLDEVEKAHPGVHDIFYQLFDKGTVRDGQGRDINFKNTLIILTSNIGSHIISKLCDGVELLPDRQNISKLLWPELLKTFKPAFLARMTVLPYLPLDNQQLSEIAILQLQRIQQRLQNHYQADFLYDKRIIDFIVSACCTPETGARNIQQILNHKLLPSLSQQLLSRIATGVKIQSATLKLDKNNEFDCDVV